MGGFEENLDRRVGGLGEGSGGGGGVWWWGDFVGGERNIARGEEC